MLIITSALLVVLVLAGLVTTYVAFPHRGEPIPKAEWLSDAMNRSDEVITAGLTRLDERVEQRLDRRNRP